jgi:hypothetical protein
MTQTAQDIHLVSTAQEYRAWHAGHMAQRRRAGLQGKAADSTTPFDAYINHGRWVVDCPCGAGNATDPAELFRRFMGRDPDLQALLVRSGLAA